MILEGISHFFTSQSNSKGINFLKNSNSIKTFLHFASLATNKKSFSKCSHKAGTSINGREGSGKIFKLFHMDRYAKTAII